MGADPAALAALAGEGDAGGELGEEEMAAGAGAEEAGAGLEGLGGGEEAMGAEEMLGAGEEGGEGGSDELEAIAKVLAEAGIDPMELAEAVAAQSEGGEEAEGAEGLGEEAAPAVA